MTTKREPIIDNPIKWINPVKQFYNNQIPKCPYCSQDSIKIKATLIEGRKGFLDIYCESCGIATFITNVVIPENVKVDI